MIFQDEEKENINNYNIDLSQRQMIETAKPYLKNLRKFKPPSSAKRS
jgi:hypothetical protein